MGNARWKQLKKRDNVREQGRAEEVHYLSHIDLYIYNINYNKWKIGTGTMMKERKYVTEADIAA